MFYEKYTLESNDIKDMMKFYGLDHTKIDVLAYENGWHNYRGFPDTNLDIIDLARSGKLRRI